MRADSLMEEDDEVPTAAGTSADSASVTVQEVASFGTGKHNAGAEKSVDVPAKKVKVFTRALRRDNQRRLVNAASGEPVELIVEGVKAADKFMSFDVPE